MQLVWRKNLLTPIPYCVNKITPSSLKNHLKLNLI
jgi:hypothetical protein